MVERRDARLFCCRRVGVLSVAADVQEWCVVDDRLLASVVPV